jgi:hypothetical protein
MGIRGRRQGLLTHSVGVRHFYSSHSELCIRCHISSHYCIPFVLAAAYRLQVGWATVDMKFCHLPGQFQRNGEGFNLKPSSDVVRAASDSGHMLPGLATAVLENNVTFAGHRQIAPATRQF